MYKYAGSSSGGGVGMLEAGGEIKKKTLDNDC